MADAELERHKQRVQSYRNFLTTTAPDIDHPPEGGIRGPGPGAMLKQPPVAAGIAIAKTGKAPRAAEQRSKSLVDTPTVGDRQSVAPLKGSSASPNVAAGGGGEHGAMRVMERSKRWARLREENLTKQRTAMEEQRLKECSFVPASHGAEHFSVPPPPPSAQAADWKQTPGVHEHMNRQVIARKLVKDAEKKVAVDTSEWTNRATRPKEFQLGRKRPPYQHQSPMFSKEYDVIRAQLFFAADAYDRDDGDFEPLAAPTPSDMVRENEELRRLLGEKEAQIRYLADRVKTLEALAVKKSNDVVKK